MALLDRSIITKSVQFAARWGFLEKGLFFKYICLKRRSQQYVYWKMLIDEGYFESSKVNQDVLYLKWGKKTKTIVSNKSSARFHLYVDHDVLVADSVLELQRNGLIEKVHLENEMKEDSLMSYGLLGGDHIGRYPDALVTSKVNQKTVAIEIEKTLKTYLRFNKILLSYSFYENVDAVLFGVTDVSIKKVIKNVFWSPKVDFNKDVGIYLTDEFKQQGLATKIELKNGGTSFHHFLEGYRSD